jgi:hypothetical protein
VYILLLAMVAIFAVAVAVEDAVGLEDAVEDLGQVLEAAEPDEDGEVRFPASVFGCRASRARP